MVINTSSLTIIGIPYLQATATATGFSAPSQIPDYVHMTIPTTLEIDALHSICESARLLHSCAALSTRQKLMVALVLNRWDWLWDTEYSMAMAISSVGSDSVELICEVERLFYRDKMCGCPTI